MRPKKRSQRVRIVLFILVAISLCPSARWSRFYQDWVAVSIQAEVERLRVRIEYRFERKTPTIGGTLSCTIPGSNSQKQGEPVQETQLIAVDPKVVGTIRLESLKAYCTGYALDKDSRLVYLSLIGFKATVRAVWAALMQGRCLEVGPVFFHRLPGDYLRLLSRLPEECADHLCDLASPSHLQAVRARRDLLPSAPRPCTSLKGICGLSGPGNADTIARRVGSLALESRPV